MIGGRSGLDLSSMVGGHSDLDLSSMISGRSEMGLSSISVLPNKNIRNDFPAVLSSTVLCGKFHKHLQKQSVPFPKTFSMCTDQYLCIFSLSFSGINRRQPPVCISLYGLHYVMMTYPVSYILQHCESSKNSYKQV